MVDETCEEDSSLFFFSHDQEEHVRRATCWTIPLSKGITIRARHATLFQSGSLVSRGKKTVGSRNPLEDQRGTRKKCKNKIDAHAQCFHAGEFSAFVRPDLKELFWRRTRFEEEEWSARLPELIIIIKKIRRRRRRREKGGKRSFLESRATPV